MSKIQNVVGILVLLVAVYIIGCFVTHEKYEDQLITISQSVGAYVVNQQAITNNYEPAIQGLVVKSKDK